MDKLLLRAVSRGQESQVATALNCGANPNMVAGLKSPVLVLAVHKGNAEIVRMLLEAGARPDVRFPMFGKTATFQAAFNNNAEVVRVLLAHSAYADGCDWTGLTPLTIAAYKGHTDVVRALVEMGADPWRKTRASSTAYRNAFIKQYTEIVSLFNAKWNERRRSLTHHDNRDRYGKRGASV